MKTLRKSLVRALVVGSMVVGGSALATPKDGQVDKKAVGSQTAHGHYLTAADQQKLHQKEFHGDPSTLEKPHFSANQARHVKSTEKASDAREGANRAHTAAAKNQFQSNQGFAGAMHRMEQADARANLEQSQKKPGNETNSDRASDEMADMAPSGGGTGDKHANQAAIEAKAKVISNDFSSARRQAVESEKRDAAKEDSKLHMSAAKQQQLTLSDRNENSSRGVGAVNLTVTPKGPEQGTHNNYFDARERAKYAEPMERMARVHTPSKFYH